MRVSCEQADDAIFPLEQLTKFGRLLLHVD
jgi:hypothetical protein